MYETTINFDVDELVIHNVTCFIIIGTGSTI